MLKISFKLLKMQKKTNFTSDFDAESVFLVFFENLNFGKFQNKFLNYFQIKKSQNILFRDLIIFKDDQ